MDYDDDISECSGIVMMYCWCIPSYSHSFFPLRYTVKLRYL